jgi:hypothetical protein
MMFAAALLALTFAASAAEWVPAAVGADTNVQLDKDTLAIDSYGVRTAWVRYNFVAKKVTAGGIPYRTLLSVESFNCSERSWATLRSMYYSDADLRDLVAFGPQEQNPTREFVPPGTLLDGVLQVACNLPARQK